MSTFFFASYISLWVIVFMLAYVVLAMMKRLYRISLPASDRGMEVGKVFPLREMASSVRLEENSASARSAGTLVFFTSADCQACKRIYPVIEQFKRNNASYGYAIFMDAEKDEGLRMLEANGLTVTATFVDDLAPFEVPGVPFAYFLSEEGKVLSKGIIHDSAHIAHLIAVGKKVYRKLA